MTRITVARRWSRQLAIVCLVACGSSIGSAAPPAETAPGDTDAGGEELEQLGRLADELSDDWEAGNNRAVDVLGVARAMANGQLLLPPAGPRSGWCGLRLRIGGNQRRQLTHSA